MHGKPFSYRQAMAKKWADYVITHDDWSHQQKILIDSQLSNARQIGLSKEQVQELLKSKEKYRKKIDF